MNKIPSVGRTVHYQAYGTPGGEFKSVPRAAIVTEVFDAVAGDVALCVLNPTGLFFNGTKERPLKYSEEPKPGCWNWPPFVPGGARLWTMGRGLVGSSGPRSGTQRRACGRGSTLPICSPS